MPLLSWLRKQMTGRPPLRRTAARFRPQLETLEGRWVPTTLHVTTTFDSGYTGDGSLRGEIAQAQKGDIIDFTIPTTDRGYNASTGTWTITLTQGELQISKSLSIQGPGASQLAISGGSHYFYGSRIFEVDGSTTTVNLSGLSLVSGNGMFDNYPLPPGTGVGWSAGGNHTTGSFTVSDGEGGAIWNGGTMTITNCTLSDNTADPANEEFGGSRIGFGGAIFNAGTMTMTNSTLANNSAGDAYYASYGNYVGNGGAIWNGGNLTVNGTSTLFTTNAAYGFGNISGGGLGGAIDNAGTLSVSGTSNFLNNSAADGGVIYSGYKLTANITGATMTNNSATYGGAVWNDGTMTLSGCNVTGNTASSAGGGIYNAKDSHLTIQSASSITGNTAPIGADLDTLGTVKISKDSTVG
jgi:predicted outer membrane repeat protein